ncbi:Yip1 family protein [Sporosarcina sp. NPDC096371]|uniref:Yip1 family protein n=1 Tax=Sporosarcina sp. NPDC096371 TaxID=3364530 RepID=UPI00382E81ED
MNEGNDVLAKKEELNLWTSIWTKPRETVRYAIDHKSMKFAIILVVIAGVFDMLNAASQNNMGNSMSVSKILLFSVVLGPLLGLIGWWIAAGIATFVGTWFGGEGRFAELKMAFAIAYIPVILGGLFWIPDLLILGEHLFNDEISISGLTLIWQLLSGLIGIVIGVWGFIITVLAVAEAHKFSGWRGFWTVVIPSVLIVIILSIFFLPFLLLLFV